MDKREWLNRMDNRMLYLNLVVTQGLILLIGGVLYYVFLFPQTSLPDLYHTRSIGTAILTGMLFALVVVSLDVYLMKKMPPGYFDDGGINERVFRDVNVLQIALIALCVAVVEEWLFRAVLQNLLGVVLASMLFALIHFRYFRKWLYAALILLISFGFGYLYEWTQSLWSVVIAHFLIDFTLGVMIRFRLLPHTKSTP